MGIPAPLGSSIRNVDNFDNYTVDFMWLLMRVLINRAKDVLSGTESETFKHIWAMADNSSSFETESINHFQKVAERLAVFVKQHLLVAVPSIPLDELLPRVDDKDRTSENHLIASLLSLIYKEECNSFGLYTFLYKGKTFSRQSYGLGLYPTAVYFNHSCIPNVVHVEKNMEGGRELHFYSLTDLEKGEEALISYMELENPGQNEIHDRKKFLKSHFYFDCDCKRCSNEYTRSQTELDLVISSMQCLEDGCRGRFIPDVVYNGSGSLPSRTDSGKSISEECLEWKCEGVNDESLKWKCEACGRFRN